MREFIKFAWPIVEPGTPFKSNWHIDAISEHLTAVTERQIKRLVINMPPRHMKSLSTSVFWPVWVWLTRPEEKWMYASYSLSLSIRDTRKSRQIIEHEWFKRNYGHIFNLRADQNMKSKYENNRNGYRIAVSTSSALTGEGADVIVADDPHNAKEADSDTIRDYTLSWWSESMVTRLNDPNTGAFVIIMQRLHEEDLSGYLLKTGTYEHLMLPEEYDPRRTVVTNIGWHDPRKAEGELLWPTHIGKEVLDGFKREMGSYGYSGQFQQSPVPAGGGIFKREWIKKYRERDDTYYLVEKKKEVQKKLCWKFISVDLAASLRQMADYTVISTFAVTPDNELILLEVQRERLEGPDQKRAIRAAFAKWAPDFVSIEAIGYQMTMTQELIRDGMPVHEYKPQRDKVSRARTASIRYESGSVYHPEFAEWLPDCEAELLVFPNGKHDDFVDTVSQATEVVANYSFPDIRDFPDDDVRKPARNYYDDPEEEW